MHTCNVFIRLQINLTLIKINLFIYYFLYDETKSKKIIKIKNDKFKTFRVL